jgi:hypothetical protein
LICWIWAGVAGGFRGTFISLIGCCSGLTGWRRGGCGGCVCWRVAWGCQIRTVTVGVTRITSLESLRRQTSPGWYLSVWIGFVGNSWICVCFVWSWRCLHDWNLSYVSKANNS